MVCISVPLKWK